MDGWKMKCSFGKAYFQGMCSFQGGYLHFKSQQVGPVDNCKTNWIEACGRNISPSFLRSKKKHIYGVLKSVKKIQVWNFRFVESCWKGFFWILGCWWCCLFLFHCVFCFLFFSLGLFGFVTCSFFYCAYSTNFICVCLLYKRKNKIQRAKNNQSISKCLTLRPERCLLSQNLGFKDPADFSNNKLAAVCVGDEGHPSNHSIHSDTNRLQLQKCMNETVRNHTKL